MRLQIIWSMLDNSKYISNLKIDFRLYNKKNELTVFLNKKLWYEIEFCLCSKFWYNFIPKH